MKILEYLHIGTYLNFYNFRSFCFFSGIKNKEKILELEINFYNLIKFVESFLSNYIIFETFNDIEKFIFNNFIKIFIMGITPGELMLLTDVDAPKYRVKAIKEDETKLFVLLTLFEIKGLPIFPIKKYFPSFFLRIEAFCTKLKSIIKIPIISFKQNADVKLYEKLKMLLVEKKCDYIIKNFPLFNNLLTIFLLERKYDDISNICNEKMATIHKLIIDLIIDNNITPFYEVNKNKEFFKIINSFKIHKNLDINTYNMLINSLVDFNKTSNIIITYNKEGRKKRRNKRKTNNDFFKCYISYLEMVNSISKYVILFSDENKSIYNVNYFIENLSKENEKRINDMKNTINLNEIVLCMLQQFEDEYSGDKGFITCLKNWINNYLKNNSLIYNLSKEKIVNILSYFKYLNLSCLTLIKLINKLKDINEINSSINHIDMDKPKNINFEYIYSNNKIIAEKGTKQSFNQLGAEILNKIRNKTKVYQNKDFNLKDYIKSDIFIYYYFNEEKEKFVESFTDINLLQFINEKTDSIKKFVDRKNINDIIFLNENISDKTMNSIFSKICFTINYKFDETQKDGIFKIFRLFITDEKDYICKYLEETAFDLNHPNYDYFRFLMEDKIKQIIFNYLNPCINFNKLLFQFCQNNFFHNYVDFSEIVSSIKETKFHLNDDINSAFQIKAINYLINNKSNLFLFLFELYEKISKKLVKRHLYEIKESFKIKVKKDKGTKFEIINIPERNSEISYVYPLITNNNLNNKHVNFKLKSVNSKNENCFSLESINSIRRNKFPIVNSMIHIPFRENYFGITIGNIYKNVFKTSDNEEKGQYKRENKTNNINYINVFEYIFTIKEVDNEKIIHVCQNDISGILSNFSDGDCFTSMLNNNGFIKKRWKLNYDKDEIEINYKCL